MRLPRMALPLLGRAAAGGMGLMAPCMRLKHLPPNYCLSV